MSQVRHLGAWPFRDETGRGNVFRHDFDNNGNGAGCVISPGYTPAAATDFPFTVATKQLAIDWFWKVMEWEYTVTWAFGTDSNTLDLTYDQVIIEKNLVEKNEGIKWTVSGSGSAGAYGNQVKSLGSGKTIDMVITSSAVPSVDYPQVIYNSSGNLWLPRVTVYLQISDDGSVSGNEYTLGLTNDPIQTYYGGADTINTSLNGKSITLTGTYDGIGGPVTLSFSPTNWPYA